MADITEILTTSQVTEISTEVQTQIVVEKETVTQVVEIYTELPSDVIVTKETSVEVIETPAEQGPPGPAGPPGAPGGVTVSYPAAASPIGGHRACLINSNGQVEYASADNPAHLNMLLGVSTGAAIAGDPVNIQAGGELQEPSWNWTLGLPIFLGINGLLTQSVPTFPSFMQVIGMPVTPSKIYIRIQPPILLSS